MKKIIISIIALLILALLALVVLLWNINPLLNHFRPDLEKKLSETLQTTIELGELQASFFPSIGFQAQQVTVGGGKRAGGETKVKNVFFSTSLFELLSGDITVSKFLLDGLDATLIREANGTIRLAGLPDTSPENPRKEKEATPHVEGASSPAEEKKIALKIQDAEIKNFNVTFIDKTISPEHSIHVRNIAISLSNFGGAGNANLELHAGLLSDSHDTVKLTASFPSESIETLPSQGKLNGSLSEFDLEKINALLAAYGSNLTLSEAGPITFEADIKPQIAGSLALENISLKAGNTSINNMTGAFTLQNNLLSTENFSLRYGELPIKASLKVQDYLLPQKKVDGTISAFQGDTKVHAAINQDSGELALQANGSKLILEDISNAFLATSSVKLLGTIETLQVDTRANLNNPQALQANISALATKGEITGFNVVGKVLDAIAKIPGVAVKLQEAIPEGHRETLFGDSTKFDSLSLSATAMSTQSTINTLELKHPLYILAGQGTVGFDGNMLLKTQLKLTPIMTEPLVLKNPNLKFLLDTQGNLVAPVIIKISDNTPIILPDVEDLAKRAVKNTAKEAAAKALDKVAPGLGGALDGLFGR